MSDNGNFSNSCITINADSIDVICEDETIPLPAGKKFHVFFSYRDVESDRTWVRKLLRLLENEHKLICCDHLRDFEPGKPIIDNIKFFVPCSLKTVVVLSKEYATSHWCKYEMEYTLCMGMTMRQNLVIPVLIDDCEIPDYLKPLTYLDARGDVAAWLPKLLQAIRSGGDLNQQTRRSHEVVANYRNLSTVDTQQTTTYRCFGMTKFNSKYLTPEMMQTKINLRDYYNIRHMVESTTLARNMGLVNVLCCFAAYIGIILLITGVVLIAIVGDQTNELIGLRNAGIAFLVTAATIALIFITARRYWSPKGINELFEVNVEAQRILIDYDLMMMTCRTTPIFGSLVITFINYDWKPCLNFAIQKLKASPNHKGESKVKESIDDTQIMMEENVCDKNLQTEATNMLVVLSIGYLCEFNFGTLPVGNGNRHALRAICLCEYAEHMGKL